MFNPSREEVRRFFCEAWRKHAAREVLTPLESMAVAWVERHPEYHGDLQQAEEAVAADYSPQAGRTNPFLHLSMHLALDEQLQIDQPPGIRTAFEAIAQRTGSTHEAAHEAMECLGETLWEAQRTGQPPSDERYLGCLKRRAGQDPGF
jgi:hypothetical protein